MGVAESLYYRMKLLRKLKEKYPLPMEMIAYLIVGGISKIVFLGTMILVQYCCQPELYPNFWSIISTTNKSDVNVYVLATVVGYAAGTVVEYILSCLFVFPRKQKGDSVGGFLVFVLISCGGLGLQTLFMYLFNGLLGVNQYIVNLVGGFVVLAYNYVVKKFILFRRTKRSLKSEKAGKDENTTETEIK